MELLERLSFVGHFASDLVRPRNFSYIECPPGIHLCQLECQEYNERFQPLEVRDVRSGWPLTTFICEGNGPTCVIYLHGLSSFSGEAKYLSEYTSQTDLSLCIFDFQGHGKSKGQFISYGLNEKSNLYSVLLQVVKRGYTDIVLWGRSMGAVTSLMFMQDPTYSRIARRYVRMLVLDSPFCSWMQITGEIASQRTSLPHFLTDMAVKLVRNKIMKSHGIDLSRVEVSDCRDITVPALFVYSREDELVNWKHSDTIFNSYGGAKERMEIKNTHNEQRSYDCVSKIFRRIRSTLDSLRQRESVKKGINIYSSREFASSRLLTKLTTEPSDEHEEQLPSDRFLNNLAYL